MFNFPIDDSIYVFNSPINDSIYVFSSPIKDPLFYQHLFESATLWTELSLASHAPPTSYLSTPDLHESRSIPKPSSTAYPKSRSPQRRSFSTPTKLITDSYIVGKHSAHQNLIPRHPSHAKSQAHRPVHLLGGTPTGRNQRGDESVDHLKHH